MHESIVGNLACVPLIYFFLFELLDLMSLSLSVIFGHILHTFLRIFWIRPTDQSLPMKNSCQGGSIYAVYFYVGIF